MKQKIVVPLFKHIDIRKLIEDNSIPEVIAQLESLMQSSDYNPTATFSFYSGEITLDIVRDETEEEYEDRKKQELIEEERIKERDLMLYKKLKAKYGDLK